ncbi:ABC transporter ATP-binding protein [Streptomyces sp. NPDC000618]|uniref:ABC transporter ATP-binding protein n=1 Tax=Streptomyces sp. NPDC000618 TaxID=3154265 RepID=UPI0033220D7F
MTAATTAPMSAATTAPTVQLTSVSRRYGSVGTTASAGTGTGTGTGVTALDDVTLALPRGSFTAVMGPSGSGKSTLLQCAAGLDRPTSGSVRIGGTELTGLSERRLTLLRRERIGFVFQAFNLLPALTAEQNVALPLRLAGRRPSKSRVREALRQVGLADRAGHRPAQLSGGQQQRVALARALITRPEVLFGDEPTGALDSTTGREVLTVLRSMVDETGQTVVMVTHDPLAASYADRVIFLVDGRVHTELANTGAGVGAGAGMGAGVGAGAGAGLVAGAGAFAETIAARMAGLESAAC